MQRQRNKPAKEAPVRMSHVEKRRQDMQVRWLKEAIVAQSKEPEDIGSTD